MYQNNEVEFNDQRHTWLPYEPLASKIVVKLDLRGRLIALTRSINRLQIFVIK